MKDTQKAPAKKASKATPKAPEVLAQAVVATPAQEGPGAEPAEAVSTSIAAELPAEPAAAPTADAPVLIAEEAQVLQALKPRGKGAKKARFMSEGRTEEEYRAHAAKVCEKRYFNQQLDKLLAACGFTPFSFLGQFSEEVPAELGSEKDIVAWVELECTCPVTILRYMGKYAASPEEEHQVWFRSLRKSLIALTGLKASPDFAIRIVQGLAAEPTPEPTSAMMVAA